MGILPTVFMTFQQKDSQQLLGRPCPRAARLSPVHSFCPAVRSQGLGPARSLLLPAHPLKALSSVVEALNLWFGRIEKSIGRQCAGTCLRLLNISSVMMPDLVGLEESCVRHELFCPRVINTWALEKNHILAFFKCSWEKLPLWHTCSVMFLFSISCMWKLPEVSGKKWWGGWE